MFVGALQADLLLPPGTSSLKEKRSVVRPLLAEMRRRFDIGCAEVGALDLRARSQIAATAVAADAGHVGDVLDACERFLAERPEIELLSVRRRLWGEND